MGIHRLCTSALLIVALCGCASSAPKGWSYYGDAITNSLFETPPGFTKLSDDPDGHGAAFTSPKGNAQLKTWGIYLDGKNLSSAVSAALAEDRSVGWMIDAKVASPTEVIWSGTKGNRMLAEAAVSRCGNTAARYRLEYDADTVAFYDPIIQHLNISIHVGSC